MIYSFIYHCDCIQIIIIIRRLSFNVKKKMKYGMYLYESLLLFISFVVSITKVIKHPS